MDVLHKMTNGTLYYLDCTFLADIQFKREGPDTIILFFSGEAPEEFPEKFFLMPEGRKYDYRAFIFTLSEEFHICHVPEEDKEYYTARAVTKDIPEERKNFRVYATIQASLLLEGQTKEKYVSIKDIGTGGFQFVSKEKFQPGTMVSAIIPSLKEPVHITACIQKQRPVRREGLYGYGCQFINLQPRAEMLIRNYVFQTEVLQAKAKKEICESCCDGVNSNRN